MENIATVNTYLELLSGKKAGDLEQFVTEDINFDGPFLHVSGREEFIKSMQQWIQLQKTYEMQHQFSEGDRVASFYRVTVMSPSGTSVDIPMADLIEFENGKIRREQLYFDPREWAKALGK